MKSTKTNKTKKVRIPCRECLVLASCRYREKVECHELYKYLKVCYQAVGTTKRYLPKMRHVIDGEPPIKESLKAAAFLSTTSKGKKTWAILTTY